MEVELTGPVVEWRGPAPYLFVALPDDAVDAIDTVAAQVTYGWGCIPCTARIGATDFTTSLFPRDGGYLLPVKVAVQRAEGVGLGDVVDATVLLQVD